MAHSMKNMEKVPELTNGEFENFIKSGAVLIDFFAEWCMPCVMMGPVMEELSEKFRGKIKFGKVNIEENNHLAQKFGVRSIPNFVLFKDGKVAQTFIGAMSEEDFEEKLRSLV
jgi:thioredoxin 1